MPAAITATYEPAEYLAFTTYIQGYPRPLDFPPFADDRFVALLGTLTITATGSSVIYDPSLVDANISNSFNFMGPVRWPNSNYNNESTSFGLFVVTSTSGGVSGPRQLSGSDVIVRLTNSTAAIPGKTFVARFYFVSWQSSSIYQPGANYTLISGTPGAFNVAVAPSSSGIWNGSTRLSVNGHPVPPSGTTTGNSPVLLVPGTPPLPFEDPANPTLHPIYDFSIINVQNLNLSLAYNNNSTTVAQAQAQVTLSNPKPGKNHGISIVFSKQQGSNSFALRSIADPTKTIPYSLRLQNVPVVLNQEITWRPLAEGQNLKNIQITDIAPSTVDASLAGTYSDTIVITITPLDTI